jgi:hypothetical protein
MIEEFEKCMSLCLIYSDDLKFLMLRPSTGGLLDGILADSNGETIQVELSKLLNSAYGLEIAPGKWKTITTLQNIEKKWKLNVYSVSCNLSKIDTSKCNIVNVDDLPMDIHPNLKWLIPLSLDLTVHHSMFNQTLIK